MGARSSCAVRRLCRIAPGLATLATLATLAAPAASAADYFDAYGLSPASPALDIGGQPLGYPSGLLSSVIARDRVLAGALAKLGQPLKAHDFRRGADMVPLLGDGRIEAGLLGDMPTLLATASGDGVVVGLVKQAATALVARGSWQVQALAGKRIGYVEYSSAHHTLLQGLAAGGLSERDVTLVALRIDEMAPALARGDIDAFAAWEPAPSLALAADSSNRIVFRGQSTDYFVLNRAFALAKPEAARQLIAGYLRAIRWLRASQRNVESAAGWVLDDAERFAGTPQAATAAQVVRITQRDLLDVPGAPGIVRRPGEEPLAAQFAFLQGLGKLPATASPTHLKTAFAYDGLAQVLREPRRYALETFDYGATQP